MFGSLFSIAPLHPQGSPFNADDSHQQTPILRIFIWWEAKFDYYDLVDENDNVEDLVKFDGEVDS